MSVVSVFCKKGGVGKTTFIAYLAHYYAIQGKKVLCISMDDQNSIFPVFGKEDLVYDYPESYLEFLMAKQASLEDVLFEARENLYLIKTLNTDMLSRNITTTRAQEKRIVEIIREYKNYFDFIFIDFPPSSSRITEVLLDESDYVFVVVGLDPLGFSGFKNTIQYFVDNDIDISRIKYIQPNSFSNHKRAPKVSLEKLEVESQTLTPNAVILPPLSDLSIIKNLQEKGYSVYDTIEWKNNPDFSRYDKTQYETFKDQINGIFANIHMESDVESK